MLPPDSRLTLWSSSRLCSSGPPITSQNQPVSPQSPTASSEPILVLWGQNGHKCTGVCESVCVCVCVCPPLLSLLLFSHWVCASSLCLLADRREGETIVLYIPRDPPLPSLGWNPFYSANSSQSGFPQQSTHCYSSGWEGDTMLEVSRIQKGPLNAALCILASQKVPFVCFMSTANKYFRTLHNQQ